MSDPVDGVVVVTASGSFDIDSDDVVRDAFRDSMRLPGHSVVVDLSDVTFMSSDFLNSLLMLQQAHEKTGGRLTLVLPDDRLVWAPLETTGLMRIFRIAENLGEALRKQSQ
ncbi:STAS domain-containing protein [Streptomyces sp. NPDC101181]|uniref:STAS domain-containing protein n=1 Tax=Streptomyces sp. NPDC101181 TaxID=3366125 RepID=UPI00380FD97C